MLYALVLTICLPFQPAHCDYYVIDYALTWEACKREQEAYPDTVCQED